MSDPQSENPSAAITADPLPAVQPGAAIADPLPGGQPEAAIADSLPETLSESDTASSTPGISSVSDTADSLSEVSSPAIRSDPLPKTKSRRAGGVDVSFTTTSSGPETQTAPPQIPEWDQPQLVSSVVFPVDPSEFRPARPVSPIKETKKKAESGTLKAPRPIPLPVTRPEVPDPDAPLPIPESPASIELRSLCSDFLDFKRTRLNLQRSMEHDMKNIFPKMDQLLKSLEGLSKRISSIPSAVPTNEEQLRAENDRLNYLIISSAGVFKHIDYLMEPLKRKAESFTELTTSSNLGIDERLKKIILALCERAAPGIPNAASVPAPVQVPVAAPVQAPAQSPAPAAAQDSCDPTDPARNYSEQPSECKNAMDETVARLSGLSDASEIAEEEISNKTKSSILAAPVINTASTGTSAAGTTPLVEKEGVTESSTEVGFSKTDVCLKTVIEDAPETRTKAGDETDGLVTPGSQGGLAEMPSMAVAPQVQVGVEASTVVSAPEAEVGMEASTLAVAPEVQVGVEASAVAVAPEVQVGVEASTVVGTPEAQAGVEASAVVGTPEAEAGVEASTVVGTPEAQDGVEASAVVGTPETEAAADASAMLSTSESLVEAGAKGATVSLPVEAGVKGTGVRQSDEKDPNLYAKFFP